MFTGRLVAIDNRIRLQKHIVSNDVPVFVMFGTPWCGPCRVMALHLEKVVPWLEPQIRLIRANTEAERSLEEHYSVRELPTMILFENGSELARFGGAIPTTGVLSFLKEHLAAGQAMTA